jgi:hypothetical protein
MLKRGSEQQPGSKASGRPTCSSRSSVLTIATQGAARLKQRYQLRGSRVVNEDSRQTGQGAQEMDGANMQLPERSKRFEWNFNTLVVVGGLSFATAANIAVAAISWNDTKRDIQDIQDKLKSETDRGIKADIDLNKAVADIAPLTFQTTRALEGVAENKKGIEASNSRIDRVVESLGGKLDTAIESINKVATRVEVLSSKLDDAQTRANKTLWRTPIMRP